MVNCKFNDCPNGATELIIHELKKAVKNRINALTETIDDAIDAVNDSNSSTISITYDKETKTLKVSDFGYGIGMTKDICKEIISNFYSHNFNVMGGISKFGLGRFYPFSIMGEYPNMTFKTSTGDGAMHEAHCSISDEKNETWNRSVISTACEKGIHGTEVTFNAVEITDDEIEAMKKYYSMHYAMSNCKITFNGNILEKFNPCYIEKLPNGINSVDGIYSIDGIVFKVETHNFTYNEKTVKFKTVAVSITQRAFNEKVTNHNDSTSAINGGVYTCLGSNILNKGGNAQEFFDLVFTRGGSGITRLFIKVYQDDDNVLGLNDVKACGYEPFYSKHFELDKFRNNRGEKMYSKLYEIIKECRKLYDRIGQGKHNYTDEENYRIAQESYNVGNGKVKKTNTCRAARKASKDVHVEFIEKMYDYVTPSTNKGVITITIPNNKETELRTVVNTGNLPLDWSTLTKEDLLIAMSHFIIEEECNSELFHKFNENIKSYIKHYEN